MIDEAARYGEADRKRREEAEALNNADSICYQAEKMLAEFPDKIHADLKSRIETARRDTRDAIGRKDAAAAREKSAELRKLLQEAGATIYAQAQAPGTGPYKETAVPPPAGEARPSGAGPRGRVVDAEYRETPKR
jgi:molecular chaperone DnaK